jgi:cystathionine beta-lyase
LVQVCHARGVVSALDNTWGAGLAFKPFEHGVDLTIHALTKYPSGGGDVLMGSVITVDQALHLRLKLTHMRLGLGVGANDVEAVLRALPSIALRYCAQDQACRALALWLQAQAEVAQVLHAALPGSPGHAHWQTLCTSGLAAGLLSIVFKPEFSSAQVDAFCDALKLFRIGYSWGGPISLVVPYDIASMRTLNMATGVTSGTVVRLAIGLEDVRDLQADLAQALQALKSLRA